MGPAAAFTNDRYPRAVMPEGSMKTGGDWEPAGVAVRSIGAGTVCVAPVTVGRWAVIAAGSVVVADVPDFGLVAGVPARFVRWVARAGVALAAVGDGRFHCPRTGDGYVHIDGTIREETS